MIKLHRIISSIIIFFLLVKTGSSQQLFRCENGVVRFSSYAPQELLSASSPKLIGFVNPSSREFAFIVNISSFEGFNAALQRDHFNENYLESSKFPEASFKGKIIEEFDFTKEGVYHVRAKGILKIHGVEQERIIKGTVHVEKNDILIQSKFIVLLKDHNIRIPKVVHEKVASEIEVSLEERMVKKNK